MKKVLTLLMILTLALSMMACEDKSDVLDKDKEVVIEVEEDRSLEEIMNEIYAAADLEIPSMMPSELTKENMAYMLGVDNFDFLEGLVSEPMMSSIAHSIVLFTVDESADIESIKKSVKENVDGRKWICVGVEDEQIKVEHVNNYVILIMDPSSDVYVDAFYQVMK